MDEEKMERPDKEIPDEVLTPPALGLVASTDLVEELLRRMDHAVVAWLSTHEHPEGRNRFRLVWKGNPHTVAGLAAHALRAVLDESYRPPSPRGEKSEV